MFAHTNFGLVGMKGSGVKTRGGGGGIRPLWFERVFEIPVRIGLIWMSSFAGPSYLTNQILCLHHLNLRSLYFNLCNLSQTGSNYIRREPRQYTLHFNEQTIKTHFLLSQSSIRPVPAQVILLWKRPPNFASNVTLYPC